MQKYFQIIADELSIKLYQVESVISLRAEGGTLPFIARYRKEKTGNLDENQLRVIFDKSDYFAELEERKQTVLESIESQGKLTDALRKLIDDCLSKTVLEDLYLPYKPKKRTRAMIAKEKGLEPFAVEIKEANLHNDINFNLVQAAAKYINSELEVNNEKEVLAGASDIIAEEIAENFDFRTWIRDFVRRTGRFTSKIKDEIEKGSTKYEMFREYESPINTIPAHSLLALRRGEAEKIILLDIKFDEEIVLDYLNLKYLQTANKEIADFLKSTIKDSFNRLMKTSLIGEVRLEKKLKADEDSISVFGENLRQMLLASPAGMKATIAIDPGFRTGCKMTAIDDTGKFLEYKAIFPFNSQNEKARAKNDLLSFIAKYQAELIAIGNGTASRETETFVAEVLDEAFQSKDKIELDGKVIKKPLKIVVSEAGASVYSASVVANEEFPDLDVTVRGAISIGRRLQDPLAELVKIDPKSIGVGQYQHDVDQKLLKKKLDEAVESSVNYVGVDLNTASKELLSYVSGINSTIAKNIVEYRNSNGAFKNRKEIKKVPRFGDKAFEQSAGFLRIRNGANVLDNTAVHPESYYIVEQFAKELSIKIEDLPKNIEKVKALDLKKFVDDKIGIPTLKDIISELEKPGRDPREEFKYAQFQEGINEIKDLKEGMILEGVITNITNFGAFVDIGVHQDGLVHVSELSNQFVTDPTKVVKVGQIVNVKVLEVNEKLKRISLSIRQTMENSGKRISKRNPEKSFEMTDLISKFQKKG